MSNPVFMTTANRLGHFAIAVTIALTSVRRSSAFVVSSGLSTAVLSSARRGAALQGLTMASPLGPEEKVVIIGGGIGEESRRMRLL